MKQDKNKSKKECGYTNYIFKEEKHQQTNDSDVFFPDVKLSQFHYWSRYFIYGLKKRKAAKQKQKKQL